uniref:GG11149 n=1 Tax=Drosophila erecta TaxID=7220 RepID=B3P8M6_DROER
MSSHVVEAGDVILKVNGTDVHRYTTKEVLKCLRLSEQLVTLELKRDPKLKARIKEQLANTQSPHYVDIESPNIYDYHSSSTNSSPNHRPNAGGKGAATTPSQSGLRYKSPTHLPSLRQNSSPLLASGSTTTTTTATHTHSHSRNSSASSTKIKVVETSITTSTTNVVGLISPTGSVGGVGGEATSPTFRPSRIPQALTKCAVPKPVPVLHSPQNKRPRPSQIPTKAANGNGNGNGHTAHLPPQSLQHSNSYSGSPVTRQRFADREPEREPEPNSAPPQPAKAPRFEAYMMTGDLILNLSRTPQTSNPLPAQAKKVDSLRDSPSRLVNPRINGALAPRASGESSPTSSSSVDSPTNTSSDSVKREAKLLQKQQQQQHTYQQQQQRDSINNSYNRKDSLTNDTLLMCEELEPDEEAEYVLEEDNKQQRQRQQQQRYRQQQNQQRYEYYQNEDELEEQEEVEEEREEDQTHYDITNIETYQSGVGRGDDDDSDRQCLVDDDDDDDAYDDEENDAGDEDYSTNSLGSGSAKQRLRALKQRTATRQQQRNRDAVDCAGRSGSGSSSTTVKSEAGGLGLDETSFSVPTSPISLSTPLIDKETANSVPTSPEPSSLVPESSSGAGAGAVVVRRHNGHVVRKCDAAGFRTSKSEDHLQQIQREGIAAVIPIDIDEDVNSSLNTLLDTRQDSEDSQASDRDRIVWTYNAPLQPHQLAALQRQQQQQEQQFQQQQQQLHQQHLQQQQQLQQQHQQQQQQQQLYGGMVLSDPSDSDSTILVSDAAAQQRQQLKQQLRAQQQQQRERERDRDRDREQSEHKVVIQVRGLDSNSSGSGNCTNGRSEEDVVTLTDEPLGTMTVGMRDASPPVSDDGSDVESLHSYHYSPKAVDMPSAIRLAKRLHSLDGFKKSDVSRHLSKNNDFSRAVADEYLKHFTFEKKSLDQALREFLQQFSLSGETQERERVLVHFSKRFLDCNPGTFNSQDAVHTLTCAIMLLNTDLHGQNMNRKMSCAEFVDNLADLNDGENFPKDVLKSLYQAIKTKPLEWALDEEAGDLQQQRANNSALGNVGHNPFLDPPELATAVEYKKGYVMRKCCYDSSFKKTPFGKRSWKMFYCTLRDLVLYLHKDEHGFRKSQMSDNLHNAIRIHHALATKANDYTKKQHVFRLQTADQAEYLFQTSDSKELQSWVETINYVCAAISAPPLEGGVGSQKRFQRPLLPSKQSKLLLKEQLDSHEVQLAQLDQELNEHKKGPIPSKGLALQNYKEKESYLQYELRRYRTYVSILSAKMLADQQQLELQAQQPTPAALEEEADTFPVGTTTACPPPTPQSINQKDQQKEQQQQPTNRKEKKKK